MIRDATPEGWPAIWPIFSQIVRAADTFSYDPAITEADVASASYMIGAGHRGKGHGRRLVEDSLRWARDAGFTAMQFNAVAESNGPAVALYEKVGFTIVGRVPEAFRHPEHGDVALLVMHRPL